MDIEKAVRDAVERYGLFGMGDKVGVVVSV
jgi:hypothetical protein